MNRFQIEDFFGHGLHLIVHLGIDLRKLVIDHRNLKFKNYADPNQLPPPDPLEDYISGYEKDLQMYGNDGAGNCVIAAKYNLDGVEADHAGNSFSASTKNAIDDYSAITGYDPSQTQPDGSNPTDCGTDPQAAAKWYNALDPSDPRYIRAWVQIDQNNMTEIRQALKIFGGIWTALALPLTAQDQLKAKEPWDYVKWWPTPRRIAGSWGGHMVGAQLIDARQPKITGKVNTWGMPYPFTQAFLDHYCILMIVYITNYWIAKNGKTPSGFDIDGLLADQKILQAA
jgi:hypothetical protein